MLDEAVRLRPRTTLQHFARLLRMRLFFMLGSLLQPEYCTLDGN